MLKTVVCPGAARELGFWREAFIDIGPGKRGHIVADTLLPTQILCPGHKNVSDFV